MAHPFVFQVRGATPGEDLDRAAAEILDLLGDRSAQISYGRRESPYVLGVVEDCSERDAGRLIGNLRRLTLAHPMLRVSLGGYGSDLPPTVLEDGRFVLFGEAYRSFCSPRIN